MSMPYRLGAIGVGGNAAGHLRRFLAMPEVDVVGLADPSDAAISTARSGLTDLNEVPAYSDWRDLLAATDPDVVLVSTPHTLHHEHVMGALNAGAHVLCEKPLATHLNWRRRLPITPKLLIDTWWSASSGASAPGTPTCASACRAATWARSPMSRPANGRRG